MIRFDGLYVAPEGDTNYYIRFYADGSVVTVGSFGNPGQVAKWLNKTSDNPKGFYTMVGSKIEFSSTDAGKIDYSGVIDGDTLHLHVYSHINGYRSFRRYQFAHVVFPAAASGAKGQSATTNEERIISSEQDRIEYYKEILNLKGDITVPKIKEAYRDTIVKYHPDKVEHLGEEFQVLAARKTVQINEAYEYFRDKYSF